MSKKAKLNQFVFHIGRWTVIVGRWSFYFGIVIFVLLAGIFLFAHSWLPSLADKKADIEKYISDNSPYRVTINQLTPYWDGLNPGLDIRGLSFHSKEGDDEPMVLSEVRVSLALLPLLHGGLEASRLVIANPNLSLERTKEGQIRVIGFPPVASGNTRSELGLPLWLSRLHNVVIQGAVLTWEDKLRDQPAILVNNINIALVNSGKKHKLTFNADFPQDVCAACSFVIDIIGDPFSPDSLRGRIYLSSLGLNSDKLPPIIRERMPEHLRGRLDLQLWTELEQGLPTSAQGYVQLSQISLLLGDLENPLQINNLSTNFSWRAKEPEWQLDMRGLQMGLSGPVWSAGHVHVKYRPDGSQLQIERANLDDLTTFIRTIRLQNPVLDYLNKLQPKGQLKNITLNINGNWQAPEDFLLRASLIGLDLEAHDKYPGVNNLTGRLSVQKQSGEFILDSAATKISVPHVFRHSIETRRATASLKWSRHDDVWEISGRDINIIADDIKLHGNFQMEFPMNRSLSPILQLKADFRDARGQNIARYYPVNILRKKFLSWLDSSIKDGRILSGSLVYEGKVKEFPFKEGNGKFFVEADIEDGVIQFLPTWPAIEKADIKLLFRGPEMLITAHKGKMSSLDVERVVIHSKDISKTGDKIIDITGEVYGSVDAAFNVLRETKLVKSSPRRTHLLDPKLRASGNGELSLAFSFPAKKPKEIVMRGEFRTRDSDFRLPHSGLKYENVRGDVTFTHKGLKRGKLQGRMLGGDMAVVISSQTSNGETTRAVARAKGVAQAKYAGAAIAPWLSDHLDGLIHWEASMALGGDKPKINLVADMKDMVSRLPAPLNKSVGEPILLTIDDEAQGLDTHVLNVHMGQYMRGKLLLLRSQGYWSYWGARLALAEAKTALPGSPGIHVVARYHSLDIDTWREIIGDQPKRTDTASQLRFTGDFDSVDFLGRHLGRLAMDFNREKGRWLGSLKGDVAEGIMEFRPESPVNSINLRLEHLNIPASDAQSKNDSFDPRNLPNINIRSEAFRYGEIEGGKMQLQAEHYAQGWTIKRFTVRRPELSLSASGKIQRIAGKDTAEIVWNMKSTDMGLTFAALGSPGLVAGGELEVDSTLLWKSVSNLDLAGLRANIALKAKKGRFLKVSQGAGRLLGVFDFSAITRYMTLDFSSLFGKGYAFDKLESEITVENGNAYTNGMQIKGPSADIHISGRVGMLEKDYNLVVGVNPSFAETLAITTWGFGVPQVGALILLFKDTFDKQIAKGSTLTYTVKGPWDDPKIKRIGKQVDARQFSEELGEQE